MTRKNMILIIIVIHFVGFLVMGGLAPADQYSEFSEKSSAVKDDKNNTLHYLLSRTTGLKQKNIHITHQSKIILPHTNRALHFYKIYNRETKACQTLAFNMYDEMVDFEESLQAEKIARYDQYGCMSPVLYHKLSAGSLSKIHPVVIKFRIKERRFDKSRLSPQRLLSEGKGIAQRINKEIENTSRILLNKILTKYKLKNTEFDQCGPFVGLELPAHIVLELSKNRGIDFIGPDRVESEKAKKTSTDGFRGGLTIPEYLPTTKTDVVHINHKCKGKGIKIAVLEDEQLCVDRDNFNIVEIQSKDGGPDEHMTASCGIIGNRYNDGVWEGYAPEASVYLANKGNKYYRSAYKWAKNKGVNVITISWTLDGEKKYGELSSRDVFLDYWACHYPWPSIFTAAANGVESGRKYYAVGRGYNFMSVGNVNERAQDYDRCDDGMASDSVWRNPLDNYEHEKPDVAAPGSTHLLLGYDFNGTSCATPVTASIAALLMCKNNSLRCWPEAIRAILMAGANYQDADQMLWDFRFDGMDGTGMVNAELSYRMASQYERGATPRMWAHCYGSMLKSDFNRSYFFNTEWKVRPYHIVNNSRVNLRHVRIAFTWNSNTTENSTLVDADLDLMVFNSSDQLIASSASKFNNTEFVEFLASPLEDWYLIRIKGIDVPNDFFSYYGIAWASHRDCLEW